MDILPIQGSAVPCECVFFLGERNYDSLKEWTELMWALQLLRFSVKQGRGLDFTNGFHWTDELIELENSMCGHSGVPKQLRSLRNFWYTG